jgi:uncharacterized protein (TIGR03437 family)
MAHRHKGTRVTFFRSSLLVSWAFSAAAQSMPASSALPAAKPMDLQQTSYEVRSGEHVPISASSETLNFLYTARSRSVTVAGAPAQGLVVTPDRSGNMVLGAALHAKPGQYNVTVSATSATGEVRQANLSVVVDQLQQVPTGYTRPPVVLLNGWETGFTDSCPVSGSSSDTFGNLASYLVSDGVPIVYLFDNCLEDPNQTIETLGNDLATFLNSIQYADGTQVPQIDLVAFSLGGLIARAYLSGLQPNESLSPPFPTLVRDMVQIAVPNFGSFVAGNYATSIAAGSQDAELIPGSSLLWNLATWNQHSEDLRGVNTIAVIGNAGEYMPNLTSGVVLNNASDGLVSETSAALGFVDPQSNTTTRIVPYCHVDPSAFTTTVFGTYLCNAAGIANVTSTAQETGQIVRSFLAGNSTWQTIGTSVANDAYLPSNGGMFFGLLNSSGSYASDLSAVAWGTLGLQNGGDTNTIFYYDFVKGTGTLEATSASLGTVDCGSYTQSLGYFSAVRCKLGANLTSVGPLLSSVPGRVVSGGSTITINGSTLGSSCSGCQVVATPAESTTGQILKVASWNNTTITATLPSSLTGLLSLTVTATTGSDSIAIIAAAPNPSTIGASPTSLTFSYTAGGSAPAAQSIQITNSGSGTLAWTATASASWLSLSASSGTAPSTLSVSIATSGLTAGSYNGTVQIASSGASNTPVTVAVTLTVAVPAPSLAVSPTSLSFSYTNGGSLPAAQNLSVANTGGGSLSWTASSSVYWLSISPASGSAPGTISVTLNPANLAPGTYSGTLQITAAGAGGSPASIAVTLVVQGTLSAPNLTAVGNAGSFQSGVGASATWLAIFGTNLSTTTYSWQNSDFVNGQLPTSLQGVTVIIDGAPAYISYLSPTQINVLAPDDSNLGSVAVQVVTAQQTSNALTFQKSQFSPAFFTIDNGQYVAALSLSYVLVGSPGLIPGVTTQPAQPGETIVLYGTGFGPTNPPLPTGQLITTPAVLANTVQITIGGATANVTYAGLVSPGLYQFNVTVPNLPNGDAAVAATIGGVTTQTGVSVTIQQ